MIATINNPMNLIPMPVIVSRPIAERQIINHRANRGRLHLKSDLDRVFEFQFNPVELAFVKRNRWEMLQYTGQAGIDPIWVGGDARTIQFSLTIDKTTCSLYDYVGGDLQVDTIATYPSDDMEKALDTENVRGTLDMVEQLESFQYPIGEFKPEWFRHGMAVLSEQFLPPPDLIFSFGEFYITCTLTELSVTHKLFNRQLIPIRSEAQLTLTVKENEIAVIDTSVKPKI